MERNPATPETINPDLSFADADAVQAMRYQNEALLPALYEDARAKYGASNDLLAQVEHHDEIERDVQVEAAKAYGDDVLLNLNGHMRREDNPVLYDRLKELFIQTSPAAMSHTEWALGELDKDGKPVNVTETSGRSRLQREIAKLQAGDYSTSDTEDAELQRILDRENQLNPEEQAAKDKAELQSANDTDAELQRAIDRDNQLNPEEQAAKDKAEREMLEKQAEADKTDGADTDTDDTDHDDADDDTKQIDDPNLGLPYSFGKHEADLQMLGQARQKLAELSIQRRQLVFKRGPKAKRLEAQYKQAQILYDTLVHDVNRYQVHDMRINGRRKEEIRGELVHNLLNEHQEFSKAERAVLEADDSRRARFARWWGERGGRLLAANIVGSFVLGYGIKTAVKGAGGLAAGALVPAAIAGGVAIRTAKSAYMATVGNRMDMDRNFDARYNADRERLLEKADEHVLSHETHDEQALYARDILHDVINRRVEIDRKANMKRVGKAALIGLVSGAAGAAAAGIVEHGSHVGAHHGGNGSGGHNGNGHGGNSGGHNGGGHATSKNPENYGFQPSINVANGEGYQQALTQLAAEQHISLSPDQSWALYEHLNDQFNGHFFTDNPSFHMNNAGEWGISHPGNSTWSPAVLEEANNWLKTNR